MSAFSSAIYSWKEVEVYINGVLVTGIQNVRYDDVVQKDFIYGAGTKPQAIKSGNESVEGSMTLFQAELEALARNAPEGRISKLVGSNIQVSFNDGLGNIVTKSILGVEFTKDGFDTQQGASNIVIEVPFMALSVTTQAIG